MNDVSFQAHLAFSRLNVRIETNLGRLRFFKGRSIFSETRFREQKSGVYPLQNVYLYYSVIMRNFSWPLVMKLLSVIVEDRSVSAVRRSSSHHSIVSSILISIVNVQPTLLIYLHCMLMSNQILSLLW